MIKSSVKKLEGLLEESEQLQGDVDQVTKYKQRLEGIEGLADELCLLVDVAEAFRRFSIDKDSGTWKKNVSSLHTAITRIQGDFENDSSFIIDSRRFKYQEELYRPIIALCSSIRSHLEEEWDAYKRTSFPTLSNELLDTLGKIPDFSRDVRGVRALNQELMGMSGMLPTSSRKVGQVVKKAKELTDVWSDLESDRFPSEVLEFLKDAGTTGVPLDRYTKEIQEWLLEHDVVLSFCIKVKER